MMTEMIQKYTLKAEQKMHELKKLYWQDRKDHAEQMIRYHAAREFSCKDVADDLGLNIIDQPLLEVSDD